MSSKATPVRQALSSGRLIRCGHRGAAHLAPENTLSSLRAAIEYGVDMIEFDVVRAAGGELVLAHDPSDVKPESPSLAAALDLLRREMPLDANVDLDLKVGGAAAEIVGLLERFELTDRALVSALHAGWLREVRDQHREVALALSYPRDRAGIAEREVLLPLVRSATTLLRMTLPFRVIRMATVARADALMFHHSVVSAAVVRRCRSRGLPVFAWTVDDLKTAREMVAAGVQGIVSNDPRVLDEI